MPPTRHHQASLAEFDIEVLIGPDVGSRSQNERGIVGFRYTQPAQPARTQPTRHDGVDGWLPWQQKSSVAITPGSELE